MLSFSDVHVARDPPLGGECLTLDPMTELLLFIPAKRNILLPRIVLFSNLIWWHF